MEEKTKYLIDAITEALRSFARERSVDLPDELAVMVERPKREGQGDWATNAAMKMSKVFGMKPIELATELASRIERRGVVRDVQAVMPGFINFFLAQSWVCDAISTAIEKGAEYGRSSEGSGRKIQVEFVSANPTGPIHLGHGRGAAVGDVVATLLEYTGWKVEREYYINDAGLQMDKLALSARSRYFALFGREADAPFPEDGYPGDYIEGIAKHIADEMGDSLLEKTAEETIELFRKRACSEILDLIRQDLKDFGVEFDVWFSEASLYKGDAIPRTIDILRSNNYAYDDDGAVWFKSTVFGDDKDRVMIRANGVPTYFTSDAAYLQNKYDRGFERIIYVWGADHHGYIPRIRSVSRALGASDDKLEFLLIQMVNLLRDGEPVAMSKRAGTFVTLREVVDEVGRDAARFSFVSRKSDSHLDFDLEVAKRTSSDNPVYYVQYAHARICSILREAASRGVSVPTPGDIDDSQLKEPSEIALVKQIARFPDEVRRAARDLDPHKIAAYATDISEAFHSFYNSHKVLGEEMQLMRARLALVEAARITISNTLSILGLSAPERM